MSDAVSEANVEGDKPLDGGPKLRLEPLSLEHIDGVMSWVNDPQVMQYFAGRQNAIGEEEERRYLRGLMASKNDRAYSIFCNSTYIGQCSINQIYWPARNGRIFLVLARQHQGRGFGRKALHLLIEKAWHELDLHKLWLIVRNDNRRAQALYLRQGFDFEGVLVDEYFVQDRFYDMVRMGIVRQREQSSSPTA